MADFYRVQFLDQVTVIDLRLPDSVDVVEFDRINESIIATVDGKASQHWVLDLSNTNYMGSAMLGLMVNIRQRIKSGGGRLVLCGMSARLAEIFRTCSMERLFAIARTRADAMKSFSR